MANRIVLMIAYQASKYGDRELFRHKDSKSGKWVSTSWNQFNETVNKAAVAFQKIGIKEQDHIAVFSQNRLEMFITDFAAFNNRAVPVPLYATSSKEQVEYIVKDAKIRYIFVGDQSQYNIARRVQNDTGIIEHIIFYQDNITPALDDKTSMTFTEVLEKAAVITDEDKLELHRRHEAATQDDLACLIYTSGTTGEPKGVMLTHRNFDIQIESHQKRLTALNENDVVMDFLPVTHIFERAWLYLCMFFGMRIVINTNPKEILQVIREVQPTTMCSVPRFWEKVYTAVQDQIAKMNTVKRLFVRRALNVGRKRNIDYLRKGLKVPFLVEREYQFFEKSVFKRLRRVIGVENGRFFPTAGAPLSNNINEFLHCVGINIVAGYGLSETVASVSCYPYKYWKIGSIGTPFEHLDVKIGEDNEILVKGGSVMAGYYNKPEETAKAFTKDGYFRTGDAGYIDKWGNLFMTERLKDLFKTSNGKYIAPQVLESRLSEEILIEQATIVGDQRKFVTALIVPNFEALEEYANQNNIKYNTIEELVAKPEIHEMYEVKINELQKDCAGFEQIKRFTILSHPFSMENGELTNTLKVRRNVVNKMYSKEIEAMYSY